MNFKPIHAAFAVFNLGLSVSLLVSNDTQQILVGIFVLLSASVSAYVACKD